ncbi:MAG: hypothetical protein N2050_01215 [Flavobacteriales bacterium]|nr:hypothetical protein [Flavobacteriales bacterium]MCX7649157.1 hypothetical protein [Flavobacteriales bacterium]MDW8432456.1 hypothetical protein [Flavobacteriales bacterium]
MRQAEDARRSRAVRGPGKAGARKRERTPEPRRPRRRLSGQPLGRRGHAQKLEN